MPDVLSSPSSSIFSVLERKKTIRLTKKQKTFLLAAAVSLFLLFKASLAAYYYNMLTNAEQGMLAAAADVQTLIQRRNDIANNLFIAVDDYSKYEQKVFTAIVSLRTLLTEKKDTLNPKLEELRQTLSSKDTIDNISKDSKINAPEKPFTDNVSSDNLLSSLSRLMAVAEQYPDLKLSANVASMMAALVQVEIDLADVRIKYNHMLSNYTTYTVKFPSNWFAWIFQFETIPYFDADLEAKSFSRIGN